MVDTRYFVHLSKHKELHNTKCEPNVKLWTLVNSNASMLAINCNKSTTVLQDVLNRGNW